MTSLKIKKVKVRGKVNMYVTVPAIMIRQNFLNPYYINCVLSNTLNTFPIISKMNANISR